MLRRATHNGTFAENVDRTNISEFRRTHLPPEANRIEQVAGTRIGMKYPTDDDIVVLQP